MGSSGEDPNKGIDASVGGLVWVRRRNGSWWPGRILSPDELPEGCVPTPRAGTPVKLLGREDASVDWYNLEKSKRIKAFHCAEYEDCIKKAKSGAFQLSKKGVKYARREDAILHALELESARLGKDCPNLSTTPDTQNSEQEQHANEPSAVHPSEESGGVDKDLNSTEDGSDSAQGQSQSSVSFEEPECVGLGKKEPKQRRTRNDSEDDGAGGAKRMRGLEDLGMGAVLSVKRKRSQVAHVHEFLKKKNRRRTLTKVLESTTALPIPAVDKNLSSLAEPSVPIASDGNTRELKSHESKNSNSALINKNSDSNGASFEPGALLDASGSAKATSLGSKLKDSENYSSLLGIPSKESVLEMPQVPEGKQTAGMSPILSDASQKAPVSAGAQSSPSSHVETISLGNEEHNESGSTSSGAANVWQISTDKIEKGSSNWQLKGKRNSRSRKVDNEAETYTTGPNEDAKLIGWSVSEDIRSHNVKSRPITEIGCHRSSQKDAHMKGSTTDPPIPQRTLPYRQSRFTVNPKYDSSDFSLSHHINGSGLFDVTIKVNSGHRPQHVPYISLMSKFNDQPIVGHPLTVEALDDGFCNDLIGASEHHTINLSEDIPAFQGAVKANKRKGASGRSSRKRGSHKGRGKLGKPPKSRRNGTMSKKTRKLSSLTGSQRLNREQKKSVAEKVKGPSVACVPLTVVFSRINAALV